VIKRIIDYFDNTVNLNFTILMPYIMVLVLQLAGTKELQAHKSRFSVIAFFRTKCDQGHISFVHEANKWFDAIAQKYRFDYDTTSNWNNMNSGYLKKYQVVLFLDTRPESSSQREAFREYMEHGGAWMGFHFAAFALAPS
jgi:uncharacterized protein